MKFVRFDGGRTGLVVGNQEPKVLDIAGSLDAFAKEDPTASQTLRGLLPGDGSGSWVGLIDNWDAARPALHALSALAAKPENGLAIKPLDAVRLLPPLANPGGLIVAIGGNNAIHMSRGISAVTGKNVGPEQFANEKAQGLPPWGFIVMPSTLAAHDDDVGPPRDVQYFDYEAEVAIVLRSGGRDIAVDKVEVWGYSAWNDLSIRDTPLGIGPANNRGGLSWALEKNFHKGNVFGPWLVVDEPVDLENIRCTLRVNGEIRQDYRTSEFIWNLTDAVSHLSHYVQLRPGDVIASGTGPGVAIEGGRDSKNWLRPGDVIEYELEGVGVLRNKVIDWTK